MADIARSPVLTETFWEADGAQLMVKRALLVALGVAALALTAKVQVPVWPSPVPVTLTTFAVLAIGAAYGPKLGLATILAYLGLGALGWDVFAGSSAEASGLTYMAGSTGGYLVGYLLATLALGRPPAAAGTAACPGRRRPSRSAPCSSTSPACSGSACSTASTRRSSPGASRRF
jgi:biotin transport system substrate-specific component